MKRHAEPFILKEIKMELTHACLLSCVHCSSDAGRSCSRQMELSDCMRILSEARNLGVKEVAFSGGEPLLWTGLAEAVGYASKNEIDVSLYSTGNAPNAIESFRSLKAVGLSRVIFSLYSYAKDGHEKITCTSGSFHATLDSIKSCISCGLRVEFHFVPLMTNYRELRSIAELARDMGVNRVSVLRLVPQGRSADYDNLKLKADENKILRQLIVDLLNKGHDVRVGSPYNILTIRKNAECCAGIDRLTISPDLRISPCDAFKNISPSMIGVSDEFTTLKKYSLSDCWEKSPYLRKIREYLTTPFAQDCSGCNKLDNCLSGCLAQKYFAYGNLAKRRDPMCLGSSTVTTF